MKLVVLVSTYFNEKICNVLNTMPLISSTITYKRDSVKISARGIHCSVSGENRRQFLGAPCQLPILILKKIKQYMKS